MAPPGIISPPRGTPCSPPWTEKNSPTAGPRSPTTAKRTRRASRSKNEAREDVEDSVLKLLPGWTIHPGPRRLRTRLDMANRRLPAVICRSRTAGFAGGLCAKRTGKKPGFPKNKLACFLENPDFFLCPGARPSTIKQQAETILDVAFRSSPGWVQGPSGPWRGFGRAERPTDSCYDNSNMPVYS